MSDVLAFVQVLFGAATFIATMWPLIKKNPPGNGGNSKHNDED